MADYVYGIVDAGAGAPDGRGVAGASVRVVSSNDAAALVSELGDRELELGRDEVLSHAHVLEEALERGAVLPMRFGIVLEGDEEVRSRLLERHADALRAQLVRFKDKVEVSIRATYDEETLMREVVEENPDIARLRELIRGKPEDATYYERIELGEHVAEGVERRREIDARNIVEALSQVSVAVEVSPPAHERVALAAAFLVERGRLTEFGEVLDAFAGGQGGRLRFKYTGPLPPHSFVEFAGGG